MFIFLIKLIIGTVILCALFFYIYLCTTSLLYIIIPVGLVLAYLIGDFFIGDDSDYYNPM